MGGFMGDPSCVSRPSSRKVELANGSILGIAPSGVIALSFMAFMNAVHGSVEIAFVEEAERRRKPQRCRGFRSFRPEPMTISAIPEATALPRNVAVIPK